MVTAELSDYIIEAILLWLPVKSLIRFKCVDKSRCDLIRSPYFAEHSALRPDATHLLLSYGRNSYFEREQTILTATTNGGATSDHALLNILEYGPFNLSCCHDLISMHPRWQAKAKGNTFVYNPNTRETLSIPFNNNAFKADASFVRSIIGFEPVFNQYKLMILSYQSKSLTGACIIKHCEVITLGTNDWRRIVFNETSRLRFGNYYSTYLDGALYWLTYDRQSIVVFDLKSDKFGTILGPKTIQRGDSLTKFELCQVREHLTLVVSGSYGAEASFELWTLQDHYNGVWVKESINFSVPRDLVSKVSARKRYLRVVGGMNNDEILITLKPEAFVVYNMKTNKGRKINIIGGKGRKANVIRGDRDKTDILGHVMLFTESMRCY